MDPNMSSDDIPMEIGQGYLYPHPMIPGGDAFMPWTTPSSSYLALSSASAVEFGAAWSSAASAASVQDDPSMFGTAGTEWSNYESISTDGMWAPSVNPSSAMVPSGWGGPSAESAWGSSNRALSLPYSDVAPFAYRPSLTRSASADNGVHYGSTGLSPNFPSMRTPASAPTSPAPQASDTAQLATASQPRSRGSSKSASKSARKSDSKSRASSTEKHSSKRKASVPTIKAPKTSHATAEQHYQAQLAARFGRRLSAAPAGQDPRVVTDQIRKEAWRICKAEALEMSHRRMKLLEHEHGALERETQQLQVNIGLMREALAREQLGLEEAITRAEELSPPH